MMGMFDLMDHDIRGIPLRFKNYYNFRTSLNVKTSGASTDTNASAVSQLRLSPNGVRDTSIRRFGDSHPETPRFPKSVD